MDNNISGTSIDEVFDRTRVVAAVDGLLRKSKLLRVLYFILVTLIGFLVIGGWISYKYALDFQTQFPDPKNTRLVWDLTNAILASFGFAATMLMCRWHYIQGAKKVRSQLRESDLVVHLANGTLNPNEFFDPVPFHMRLGLVKQFKGASFFEVVEAVASSLNWYLNPPKNAYTSLWWWLLVIVIVAVIITFFGFLNSTGVLLMIYFLGNLVFVAKGYVNYFEFARYIKDQIAT